MNRDLFHSLDPKVALATATIATDTDTDGIGIDTEGFEAVLFLLIAATIADGTYTIKLQHSDDDGATDAYTDVDSDGLIPEANSGQLDGTTDDKILSLGYRGDKSKGSKRWVRMVVTSASTTSGGTFTGAAIKGHSRFSELTNQVS